MIVTLMILEFPTISYTYLSTYEEPKAGKRKRMTILKETHVASDPNVENRQEWKSVKRKNVDDFFHFLNGAHECGFLG